MALQAQLPALAGGQQGEVGGLSSLTAHPARKPAGPGVATDELCVLGEVASPLGVVLRVHRGTATLLRLMVLGEEACCYPHTACTARP